jgi:hypothetical protein
MTKLIWQEDINGLRLALSDYEIVLPGGRR